MVEIGETGAITLTLAGIPQTAQRPFFTSQARHIGYGGARGGGKSWAMRRKFVLLALRYGGLKLLLLRRTYPELKKNHIWPLMEELAGFARYNAEDKTFFFPNGSKLCLGYCDNEADVLQYQGQEYDVIGFEEATHFAEAQVKFILTCNRTTRTDFAPRAYYTANPGGVGHSWFKRLFYSRQYEEGERAEDYHFIAARVYDNPALMNADPGYLRTLQGLPPDLRRMHLDGDWDVFAGQVFYQFRRDIHVVPAFTLPVWWKTWVSHDPGINDAATWYLHAADEGKRVYTVREWVFSDKTSGGKARRPKAAESEQARQVKADLDAMGADPSITVVGKDAFNANMETGKSSADYIKQAMETPVVPAIVTPGSRANRARVVHEYLDVKTEPLDEGGERKIPGVIIFDCCEYLIRTIPEMVADENDPDAVADHVDDHGYDGWSYGLQWWHARRSTAPEKERYKAGSAGDILNHAKKWEELPVTPKGKVFG